MKKIIAILLCCIMLLCLCACGEQPTETPTPDETPTSADPVEPVISDKEPDTAPIEVTPPPVDADNASDPRFEVFMLDYHRGGYSEPHYQIPISKTLDDALQAAISSGVVLEDRDPPYYKIGSKDEPADHVFISNIYYKHSDSSDSIPIRILDDGRVGLGSDFIDITDEAPEIFGIVEAAMGWSYDLDLSDYSDLTKVEIWHGDEFQLEITDSERLDAFVGFVHGLCGSTTPGNTESFYIELKCTSSDGTERSILVNPWEQRLFFSPSFILTYYEIPTEFGGDPTKPLLDALGIEEWPAVGATKNDYIYIDGFFDDTYDRVCPLPEKISAPFELLEYTAEYDEKFGGCAQYTHNEDGADMLFLPSESLSDFSLVRLRHDVISDSAPLYSFRDKDRARPYYITDTLHTVSEVTPEVPLRVKIMFVSDSIEFGVTFTDESGAERAYALTLGSEGDITPYTVTELLK